MEVGSKTFATQLDGLIRDVVRQEVGTAGRANRYFGTVAEVDTVNNVASVFLMGSDVPSQGFRVRGFQMPEVGENVSVLIDGQDRWIESIMRNTGADSFSTSNPPPSGEADITPPAIPTNLALSSSLITNPDGTNSPILTATWDAVTDTDFFFYEIELAQSSDFATSSQSQNTSLERCTFRGLAGNTQYWVHVRSIDTSNNKSAWSTAQSITVVKDTSAPAKVAGLVVGVGRLTLGPHWTANSETDISYYEVQRAIDSGGTPGVYATVAIVSASWFVDNSVVTDATYWYKVRAVDTSGNAGAYSDAASATVGQVASDDIAANSITVEHLAVGGPLLLVNPGFELTMDGSWDQGGDGGTGATCYLEDGAGHSWVNFEGLNVCVIYPGTGAWRYVRQRPANMQSVAAGEYVNVSCLAGANTTSNLRIGVDCFNSAGSNFSSPYQTFTVSSRTMQRFRARLLMPAGTVKARVFVGNATTNTYLGIDDVAWSRGGVLVDSSGMSIYEGALRFIDSTGTTAMDGDGFGPTWQDFIHNYVYNAVMGDGVDGALTVGASYTDQAGRTSKLPNWLIYKAAGSPTASRITEAGSPGGHSVQFSCAAAARAGMISDKVAVTPGRVFAVESYVNVTSAASANLVFGIKWLAADGTVISTVSETQLTAPAGYLRYRSTNGWQAPINARYAQAIAECYNASSAITVRVGMLLLRDSDWRNDWDGYQTFGNVDASTVHVVGTLSAQEVIGSDGTAPGLIRGAIQLHAAPEMFVQTEATKTITTSVAAVTGCSTGALTVQVPEYWIVDLTCDFSGTAGATKAVCVGQLYLDGTALATPTYGEALWQAPVGGGEARGTVSQAFVIPVSAGSHTLDLRVSKSANYGTFASQQYHTGFRLQRFAQ